ncbi:MAG: right-handed parallel beta-helix repeat-containing protein [Pseudomonadota bacterium]
MSQFLVDTTAELISAVKAAKSGDVVLVEAGSYSGVNLSGINIAGNVTIASASADTPAKFLDLTLKSSSGLSFSNLHFTPPSTAPAYGFSIGSSSNIHFDGVKVIGPAGDAGYSTVPFLIRNSNNITISESEFTHVQHGVNMLDSTNISITGSYFHDIRTDAIRGGGVSGLTVSGNYITNLKPTATDHADGIQLWTTNTTTSASNIVISNNLITRGDGLPFQGIFLRDQVGTLAYKNVAITGNTVVGTLYNGIMVDHVENLTMTSNTVAGMPDMKSWIQVASRVSGIVANNQATLYMFSDGNTNLTNTNNTKILTPLDTGSSLIFDWLSKNTALYTSTNPLLNKTLTTLSTDLAHTAVDPDDVPLSIINGTSGADALRVAFMGDSNLNGYAGSDTLYGGAGNNQLAGGSGDDFYHVKGAGDVVVEAAASGTDTVYAYVSHKLTANVETLRMNAAGLTGEGNDLGNRIVGSTGVDTLYGHGGADVMQGNVGDDTMFGGAGNDNVMGNEGNDRLDGGDGNDTLSGAGGNDVLIGGAGNDRLDGGSGSVTSTGGTGTDLFIFRTLDKTTAAVITDFSSAQGDRIDLTLVDSRTGTLADDYFRFIGTSNFTKSAGQLRYSVVDGDTHVYGDVNGDGLADFDMVLQNVTRVDIGDFIL